MESIGLKATTDWDLIIRRRRRWFDLRLGDLWRYRDLIGLFVWRDFVAQYKQTMLGPLWYLIQPLMTTLTFTVVFGNIARLPTDGQPQFLFYLAGTTLWGYFAGCVTKTSNTFVANAAIFGKVYFPRLSIPISVLASNFITFAIQLGQLLIFMLFWGLAGAPVHPSAWAVGLLPLLVVMMAGLGLGLGIIVSAMTTRYRDLQVLVVFGVQLLMYATPVVYPLSAAPEKWRWLIALNPLTPIMEGFRFALLGSGSVTAEGLLYSFGIMLVILLAGVFIFNRVEDTFMDTV